MLSLTVLWQPYRIHLVRRLAKLAVRADQAILITGVTPDIGLTRTKHLYKFGYSIISTYYNACETGHFEMGELSKKTDSRNRLIPLELVVRIEVSTSLGCKELNAKLEGFDEKLSETWWRLNLQELFL